MPVVDADRSDGSLTLRPVGFIRDARLRVGSIEAADGTPIVDVKVVIGRESDVR